MTAIRFQKLAGPSRYAVLLDGVRIGTVWNNGARTTYGRHWSYRASWGPDSTEGRTGSRQSAGEALARGRDRA